MTWELAFQTFTAALASIGGWFMYDLVKEFKSFKKDTSRDIRALQSERENFQVTVKEAELNIALRVTELQALHNDFSLNVNNELNTLREEISAIRSISRQSLNNTRHQADFLKKALDLNKRLEQRLQEQEQGMTEVQDKLAFLMNR